MTSLKGKLDLRSSIISWKSFTFLYWGSELTSPLNSQIKLFSKYNGDNGKDLRNTHRWDVLALEYECLDTQPTIRILILIWISGIYTWLILYGILKLFLWARKEYLLLQPLWRKVTSLMKGKECVYVCGVDGTTSQNYFLVCSQGPHEWWLLYGLGA